MFLGAYDMGFLCYALIATENAARVAVLYTSLPGNQNDSATACQYVLAEFQMMSMYSTRPTTCSALPVLVTVASGTGPDGMPASTVTVTYKTIQLIPIPILPSQLTIKRTAEMRVRT